MTDEMKTNPAENKMLNEEAVESVSGGRLIGDFIDQIEMERKENPDSVLIPGIKGKNEPGELNPFSVLEDESEGNE